jgi:hypothetical protein
VKAYITYLKIITNLKKNYYHRCFNCDRFLIGIIFSVMQKTNNPCKKPCGLDCYKNYSNKVQIWRLFVNGKVRYIKKYEHPSESHFDRCFRIV